jgi:uncharacterized protein YwqG
MPDHIELRSSCVEAGRNRAGFFRDVLRAAAEVVQEFGSAMRSPNEPEPSPEEWVVQRPVQARRARRAASLDDLSRLCGEVGLRKRVDDVLALARPSLRLTLAGEAHDRLGGSRLGGAPDVPPGFSWPTWEGEDLVFLGQVSLEDVAVDPSGLLPPQGLLLFFYDTIRQPSGLEPAHRGSCQVVLYGGASSSLERASERDWFIESPLDLSLELTVPSFFSLAAEQLDLDTAIFEPWEELRRRLAHLQGVELEELLPESLALHRLLGYPEELHGRMELACQLASQGIDVSDGTADADSRADELAPDAADWRLLLQLSTDDDVGFYWGDGLGRLYLWIRERDLVEHKTSEAWAILQSD